MSQTTAQQFQRKFGEYQHKAQREPVEITRHGRRELVLMAPQPVRTPHLAIDEPAILLPLVDPRQPSQRHAVQPQAVLDHGPGRHRDRTSHYFLWMGNRTI